MRGDRLWDRENHTFAFTDPIKVRITISRTFEELPEAARRFIAMKAARVFQDRIEGRSEESDARDEMAAMTILQADELRNADHNALTSNWSTLSTIRRHAFGYISRY